MKLQVPFIQLPLSFDAERLEAEVAALGEDGWKPHPQGFAGNSMLPLVAVGGDPDDEGFTGEMRPTPHLQRCPYLRQVIASLGTVVGRSRLMRLSGHAEVNRHADQGYYWAERVRVHVPVVTQPTVRFECGDAAVHMAAGECWIFDTWRQHRVINDAVRSRIHLVVDTVGGEAFWELVARGRPHNAPRSGWTAQRIEPHTDAVELVCERANVPAVMSPWELNTHLALLFEDAVPHPALARMSQLTGRFARAWRALWAAHGDGEGGRPQFRALLARYLDEMRAASQGVLLKNELAWYGALHAIVGRAAVRADENPAQSHRGADNG
ncbi:MAG TPA: aspartyl/asparaginyl beta-hydroxylase domain-containing protein [Lysobacter sp.]|nr:aspartyl/asparaginyl beta-hydroxylase domain-containing protein [Lysobacter sp.]